MKHRESTRLISDYMRKVNPGIAKVLLDERNEVNCSPCHDLSCASDVGSISANEKKPSRQ